MIHEVIGLDSLTQLETLDLSENDIRRVEGLGHLKKLKFLNLSGMGMTVYTKLLCHVRKTLDKQPCRAPHTWCTILHTLHP